MYPLRFGGHQIVMLCENLGLKQQQNQNQQKVCHVTKKTIKETEVNHKKRMEKKNPKQKIVTKENDINVFFKKPIEQTRVL